MALKDMIIRGYPNGKGHYQRLSNEAERASSSRPKRRWLRRINGGMIAFRLSTARRVKWRRFSAIMLSQRAIEFYAEIANMMKMMDGAHPTIIFSSQWGLPVLSHPSLACRKRMVSVM